MILVVTPETIVRNETEIINQMFQEGLDLLHIRKPMLNREEIALFLSRIDENFYPQLVLHGYYDLGKDHDIFRFHFREDDRNTGIYKSHAEQGVLSTSVHTIETYNALGKEWEYTFISPVFPSISKKGYGEESTVMEEMKQRNNPDVKLIALGGINENNINRVFENGADGAALLGAVWENDQPLIAFKKCRQKYLLSQI
ncbi:thiamine phosphate synthase [Chryseobacterium luteum]|uniref:Thiamine monophosphate synthase n=1 Tax=Chryseobacterium luteum TaxID=421531 RepID=A0A085ZYI5_9FLAO|nr:thiamine phosphate synthase [Chryseobacterium luteum]KFF09499.1 thiamine monophosphate synthase [Chryseobacterium luteum]